MKWLALAAALPALAASPQAEELLQRSGLAAAAGQWERSLTLATQASAADPAEPRCFLQWSVAAESLGRHQEAAEAARRAMALGFQRPAGRLALGEALLGLGQAEGALAEADAALKLNAGSEQGRRLRARALQALGRPPDLETRPRPASRKPRAFPLAAAVAAVAIGGLLSWLRRRQEVRPRGESLRQLMTRRGKLSPATVLRVAAACLSSLPPGNVSPEHLLSEEPVKAPAAAAYWPPERESGARPTPEGDLYSLAVCLYEALTGRLPFETTEDKGRGNLLPPSRVVAVLSSGVDAFFQRALASEPGRRFQDPREFLNALRSAVAPPVE